MAFRRVSRRAMLAATNELGAGDGLDPRFELPSETRKVPNRKALLLCGQVAETLALVFADSADEVLQNLLVESVRPFPTAVRLLVTLTPAIADGFDVALAAIRVEASLPRLRAEVATAICRRKASELLFRMSQ